MWTQKIIFYLYNCTYFSGFLVNGKFIYKVVVANLLKWNKIDFKLAINKYTRMQNIKC